FFAGQFLPITPKERSPLRPPAGDIVKRPLGPAQSWVYLGTNLNRCNRAKYTGRQAGRNASVHKGSELILADLHGNTSHLLAAQPPSLLLIGHSIGFT